MAIPSNYWLQYVALTNLDQDSRTIEVCQYLVWNYPTGAKYYKNARVSLLIFIQQVMSEQSFFSRISPSLIKTTSTQRHQGRQTLLTMFQLSIATLLGLIPLFLANTVSAGSWNGAG